MPAPGETQPALRRAQWLVGLVVFGLVVSAVTVWPAISELKLLISVIWGDSPASGVLHEFLLRALDGLIAVKAQYRFMYYALDWLAFAHLVLAILFAGAMRDLVRNLWVIECGLIMCALIPLLAGICIPLRGIPWQWFLVDGAFAPAAGLPLWLAWRDIRRVAAIRQEAALVAPVLTR